MEKEAQITVDKQYSEHTNALVKYDLAPKMCPILKELWMKADTPILINEMKWEDRCMVEHNTYFCVWFYNIQRVNIQSIIKRLLHANGLV